MDTAISTVHTLAAIAAFQSRMRAIWRSLWNGGVLILMLVVRWQTWLCPNYIYLELRTTSFSENL